MIDFEKWYSTRITAEDILWQHSGNDVFLFHCLTWLMEDRRTLRNLPQRHPERSIISDRILAGEAVIRDGVPVSAVDGSIGKPINLQSLKFILDPPELLAAS